MPRLSAPVVPASLALALTILLGPTRDASADVVYSDGLNHTVTIALNDRFVVNSNSTLTLGVGGAIMPPAPRGSTSVSLSSATLTLAGGTIGGSFYGVNGLNAGFNATSGTVNGGNFGGSAVWLESGNGNISGGTFNGGSYGGNALMLDSGSLPFFLNTKISGGHFHGGANAFGRGGSALFLTAFGTNTLSITGGTFTAGTGSSPSNLGASLRVLSSTNPSQDSPLNVTVSGGLVTGEIDLRTMYKNASVTFQGSGLSFADQGNGTGVLTGTLLDGTTINTLVLDAGDSVGALSNTVVFNGNAFTAAIPEPSPLILAAVAALVAGGYGRLRGRPAAAGMIPLS